MLDIRLGAPQAHEFVTIFPLLAGGEPELPYALLGDALAAGTLRIAEIGQGTVPSLHAQNLGEADVLLLDGEQLIGSKQNRMTNRSILLPARSTVELPVSCMEHGRWHFGSDHMAPAPQHSPAKVRRRAREVEAMHARAGVAASESVLSQAQSQVWDAIADTASRLNAHSPTGAMDDIYRQQRPRLDDMARAFPCVGGQVGLLAFAPGGPIGLDLVGGRALYARLHARLLRGYLLDALDRAAGRPGDFVAPGFGPTPGPTGDVSPEAAESYLAAVRAARRVESPTVGKGTYAVLAGTVIGGELLDGAAVAHLSAFPAEERPGRRDATLTDQAPLARPSERRRFGYGPGRE